MTIKTTISFKEYSRLLLGLAYRRPLMKFVVGVGLVLVIWMIGYYLQFLPVSKPEIYQFIALTFIMVVQPTVIYWTIKRNYASSNHLAEVLNIEVTEEEIRIRGDSFYMELTWKKIFKAEEEIKHFLIYQNNLSAIIISKKQMTSADIRDFRAILENIPDVPTRLKHTER